MPSSSPCHQSRHSVNIQTLVCLSHKLANATALDACGRGQHDHRYFTVQPGANKLPAVCFNSCTVCAKLVTKSTTASAASARDYQSALQATGCPNQRLSDSSHWDVQSLDDVYNDMHTYCTKVRDGSANEDQVCRGDRSRI